MHAPYRALLGFMDGVHVAYKGAIGPRSMLYLAFSGLRRLQSIPPDPRNRTGHRNHTKFASLGLDFASSCCENDDAKGIKSSKRLDIQEHVSFWFRSGGGQGGKL